MNWRKSFYIAAFLLASSTQSFAQDNLINALKNNVSDKSKDGFVFTEVINLGNTSIKDQGSSGTCWSYSGNSFLESEMIRMGKQPVEISQIFTAYYTYLEKAKTFVQLHGDQAQGEGGQLHDVLTIYRKYGAVPKEVYTGLREGQTRNNFSEMSNILQNMNENIVKNKKLTPNWQKAVTGVMDAYLGVPPQTFQYNGKTYTPRTWADQVVGINPDDYIGISSFKAHDYYKPFVLLIPDNWSYERFYNVKMNDLTDIIDNALQNGYTVAWATDVSEKFFSWKNGVAFVPEKEMEKMTQAEVADLFNGPKQEAKITEEIRQAAYDDYSTTDDHGMHIVGLVKDQNGKEYYIVKNSWGESNDYKGYMYATKEYVKYKTISILLHKNAIQKGIKSKLGI
ncbi:MULTISPECIES: aminopeptidase C [Sphingobacterium]|uniref:Aminopeptidase n=1 Tax=Sphingobacterium litopenaei TaxID=2763500 RepID=A0ABR7YCH5_9SPHI|nr:MULTISPECIES: C1 family peptidase [Sphingobacterium]MBD1429002.1 aminopeptidase [Sphingobacterium litopenaei]NGM72350.1 aminopeptidase [Sphingobacterium sp. SGL-16]